MRVVNLSKKIVDKILFLRINRVVNILMLIFALFSTIAIALFLSISKQENFRFYKRKMNCFRLNLKLPNI
ncbi:hypothetical protein D6212_08770 [Campylobacter jejuni]|nr:hypothetical protein [Campylobacter coli]EAH4809020.1 hypothetical protein [Campylobacter jejuni]EAH4943345.1 hypothetical protein [Campylobacter coli]EAH4943556.1 hypothetical protein [Campylobacter coli]EAH6714002.1 hypothetical protein [Campylobacter coli]